MKPLTAELQDQKGVFTMGPWYYEVVSFDGDYVNLRRTDIESDELNPVALALLPPESWPPLTASAFQF